MDRACGREGYSIVPMEHYRLKPIWKAEVHGTLSTPREGWCPHKSVLQTVTSHRAKFLRQSKSSRNSLCVSLNPGERWREETLPVEVVSPACSTVPPSACGTLPCRNQPTATSAQLSGVDASGRGRSPALHRVITVGRQYAVRQGHLPSGHHGGY